MLERQASIMVFLAGGKLGFLSADVTKLAGNFICLILRLETSLF
jgi:hypothetical protein